jgi:hypothetical protein
MPLTLAGRRCLLCLKLRAYARRRRRGPWYQRLRQPSLQYVHVTFISPSCCDLPITLSSSSLLILFIISSFSRSAVDEEDALESSVVAETSVDGHAYEYQDSHLPITRNATARAPPGTRAMGDRLYDTGGDGLLLSVEDFENKGHMSLAIAPPAAVLTAHRRESIGDSGVMSARYLGSRVFVDSESVGGQPELGILRFVGPGPDGETICGVELDRAVGEGDGLLNVSLWASPPPPLPLPPSHPVFSGRFVIHQGHRYFLCPKNHGTMVPAERVHLQADVDESYGCLEEAIDDYVDLPPTVPYLTMGSDSEDDVQSPYLNSS